MNQTERPLSSYSIDDIYAGIIDLWEQRPPERRRLSDHNEFINELNRNDPQLLTIIRHQGSFGDGMCDPLHEIRGVLQPFTLKESDTQSSVQNHPADNTTADSRH